MKKSICFIVVLCFILFSSCSQKKLDTDVLTINRSDGSQITLVAEMARTEQEQAKGFMERKLIPEGTGMLFLFSSDRIARFWMKNTPIPLSIAYIDYKGHIRDIFDMTPFSLADIVSSCSVRYALEVPKGWFEKNNIKIGDSLILNFK